MKVLALIPARGGSKGIPRKNIANCAGRPLVAWTCEAAHGSSLVSRVVVSTEDNEIANVAADYATVLWRPAELAQDDTPMEPVALHALRLLPAFDVLCLLQPTSPLRSSADIDGALTILKTCAKVNSVVSVHASYAVPFTGEEPVRRQDRKPTLMLNGAIYAVRVRWFMESRRFMDSETVPYVMPAERSVDVDFPHQLALAGLLISQR